MRTHRNELPDAIAHPPRSATGGDALAAVRLLGPLARFRAAHFVPLGVAYNTRILQQRRRYASFLIPVQLVM
jgi:hypothetical protein